MTIMLQDWWCPMCGGMDGGMWGWGMMFFWALFWIALLGLAVWLVVRLAGGGSGPGGGSGAGDHGREDRAEEILRERYARGEIDRETYERMLDDLRRGG